MNIAVTEKKTAVKPNLIIGLGGTGVRTCLCVQQYIKDILGSKPPFVEFLKFDTDAIEGNFREMIYSDYYNLKNCGVNIGDVAQDYVANSSCHPHLEWLNGTPICAHTSNGSQGIPRHGRLAFSELCDSVIYKAVISKFSLLKDSTKKPYQGEFKQFEIETHTPPVVHITSSVCGGAGAGMLIDMAYNVREWARQIFGQPAEIIGHLMLPEAFTVDPILRPKLEAVALATLEQIEMLSHPNRPQFVINYRNSSLVIDQNQLPFDYIFLINGDGDTGISSRNNLLKMMAKTIQVMTITPTAQELFSDANNKLFDILNLNDKTTGRRQLFSSYGLWYGRDHQSDDSAQLMINNALIEMKKNKTKEEKKKKINELIIQMFLKSNPVDFKKPLLIATQHNLFNIKEYADIVNKCNKDREEIVKRLIDDSEQYLKMICQHIRSEADTKINPKLPDDDLYKFFDNLFDLALKDSTEVFDNDDVLIGHEMYGYDIIYHLFHTMCDMTDNWLKELKEEEKHISKPDECIENCCKYIVKCISEKLHNLAEKEPIQTWPGNKLETIINDIIIPKKELLVSVILKCNLYQSRDLLLKRLRLQLLAINDMIDEVSNKEALEQRSQPQVEDKLNIEHFSTDIEMQMSDIVNTPDDNIISVTSIVKAFRVTLLLPYLHNILDAIHEYDENKYHQISKKEKKSTDNVILIKNFSKIIDQYRTKRFCEPVANIHKLTSHEYYWQTKKVYDLASPKIRLDSSGKYSENLDVTFVQHISSCCIPDLLRHHGIDSFREAHVSDKYMLGTNELFQVLRVKYGFSLSALANYGQYQKSSRDYITKRGFNITDMWLDNKFYEAHICLREKWKEKVAEQASTYEMNQKLFESMVETIILTRKAFEDSIIGLRQYAVDNPEQYVEIKNIIQYTEMVSEMRKNLQKRYDEINKLFYHPPLVRDNILDFLRTYVKELERLSSEATFIKPEYHTVFQTYIDEFVQILDKTINDCLRKLKRNKAK